MKKTKKCFPPFARTNPFASRLIFMGSPDAPKLKEKSSGPKYPEGRFEGDFAFKSFKVKIEKGDYLGKKLLAELRKDGQPNQKKAYTIMKGLFHRMEQKNGFSPHLIHPGETYHFFPNKIVILNKAGSEKKSLDLDTATKKDGVLYRQGLDRKEHGKDFDIAADKSRESLGKLAAGVEVSDDVFNKAVKRRGLVTVMNMMGFRKVDRPTRGDLWEVKGGGLEDGTKSPQDWINANWNEENVKKLVARAEKITGKKFTKESVTGAYKGSVAQNYLLCEFYSDMRYTKKLKKIAKENEWKKSEKDTVVEVVEDKKNTPPPVPKLVVPGADIILEKAELTRKVLKKHGLNFAPRTTAKVLKQEDKLDTLDMVYRDIDRIKITETVELRKISGDKPSQLNSRLFTITEKDKKKIITPSETGKNWMELKKKGFTVGAEKDGGNKAEIYSIKKDKENYVLSLSNQPATYRSKASDSTITQSITIGKNGKLVGGKPQFFDLKDKKIVF